MEKIVSENWQSKVAQPYSDWNVDQLKSYLKERGIQAQDDAAENKDSLVSQVKNIWYEKEDKSEDAWSNIKDWIFDDWSDSRLRAFADKYGITVPEPQKKESTLQAIRSSYDAIAKKLGQSVAYPGDWLYETWSDSGICRRK